MNKEITKEKLVEIKENLNKEILSQENFIENICAYFEKRLIDKTKGILLIVEERDIFKETGIKLLFEQLYKNNLIKNNEVNEIDLGSYNFNLGYNMFLSDLYQALNSESEGIIFKNAEKSNKEVLDIVASVVPNSCIVLKEEYTMKNSILIKKENNISEEDIVQELLCNDKFFIVIYNNDNKENEKFFEEFLPNKDSLIYTNCLTEGDKLKIVELEFFKGIKSIENDFDLEVIVNLDDNYVDGKLNLVEFLKQNYKLDGGLSISEYISYKIYKPIENIIRKENLQGGGRILLYIENDELYCKINDEVYNLNGYLTLTLEEAKYKLQSIIGMKDLKDFIDKVENNHKVQKIREKLGLKTPEISLNMIFAGNAGTGKTNAARVTFEYLNALGLLSKPILKEVSKADFVGETPADSARKTNEIINTAIGGVLFIDEAYSLCKDKNDKAGMEIVDALLKGIEDNRDDLIVILAGYEKDMETFLGYNQGLKSRFSNTIKFEDYNPVEMYKIAVNIAKSKGYKIANNVKQGLIDLFTKNQLVGKNDLGNARFVRNIVENAIMDASKKYVLDSSRQIDSLERDNFNFNVSAKFDLEEKLEGIIGLEEVKVFLRSQYKLIVAQEKRKSVGVKTKIEQNLNMVFAGNPGTGKTSIARLVAEMLSSMGLVKVGQLVETDRSSFVSNIPGETSKKTEERFKEAIGGVLFIDEAYTLANDSLGREAIETLLKLIEDHSREVVVILAGYEKEMDTFFDVNIGLRSRFPLWTKFEDYNANELFEMALKLIEANGFKVSKNANTELKKNFVKIYENSDSASGNGRMIRNYVEQLIRTQSIRIAENDISVYEMNLINVKDIEEMNSIKYDGEFNLEEKLTVLAENEYLKDFLRNQYKIMKIREKRRKIGMEVELNKYMNMVFTGEVGTGKKTVLNILSEMYYYMGITKAKNIVEIDKYEFMSMVNSGIEVEDILHKYLGKILYIDKWDTFVEDSRYNEVVAQLIKFIDTNNNRIVVVLGGNKSDLREVILTIES